MFHLRKEGAQSSYICLCIWRQRNLPMYYKGLNNFLGDSMIKLFLQLNYNCITHWAQCVWKSNLASEYKHLGVTWQFLWLGWMISTQPSIELNAGEEFKEAGNTEIGKELSPSHLPPACSALVVGYHGHSTGSVSPSRCLQTILSLACHDIKSCWCILPESEHQRG